MKQLLNIKKYSREEILTILKSTFEEKFSPITNTEKIGNTVYINGINHIGNVNELNLAFLEIEVKEDKNPYIGKVGLHKEIYNHIPDTIHRDYLLVFTYSDTYPNMFRISFLSPKIDSNDKIVLKDAKRFSFIIGQDIHDNPINTKILEKQLKEKITTIEELEKCFEKEKVHKGFYSGVYKSYQELRKLNIGEESAFLLIGRILFCRFLVQKTYSDGTTVGNYKLLTQDQVEKSVNYYKTILSLLFFDTLNKQERHFKDFPYLNGGLFNREDGENLCEKIPNKWFTDFYNHIDQFYFTIDENSEQDTELSLDPALLGNIFESLLHYQVGEGKDNKQKETGSFYTPRHIVHKMIKHSFRYYLEEQVEPVTIDYFINGLNTEQDAKPSETEIKKLQGIVKDIKILDPACGSGHFPMDMLEYLVDLNQELNSKEEDRYTLKRRILKDNIYGVDIQPIAVDISMLRAFLALVIDQNPHKDKDNLGFQALPNLEFKFIRADSLNYSNVEYTDDMFQGFGTERLKNIQESYYTASVEEKPKIYIEWQQEKQSSKDRKLLDSQLEDYDPFNPKKVATIFHPELAFAQKDFDIIIGNPPYLQIQGMQYILNPAKTQEYKDNLVKLYKQTVTLSADLYVAFIQRGMELLKPNGILGYITSNKYMRAKYGKGIRDYILKKALKEIEDLGPDVFPNATVDTAIIHIKQAIPEPDAKVLLNNKEVLLNQNMFLGITDTKVSDLKAKIESLGKPLKDWDISINYGIKTGFNEAFIIDTKTKEELCKQDPKSAEILKPLLRGRDIDRYSYKWADLWLIYIPWHFPLHQDSNITGASSKAEESLKERFPAIYSHLLRYKKKLSARNQQETGIRYEWYALQRWGANYYQDFEKEKIVYPNMKNGFIAMYDTENYYANQKCFIIVGKHLKFLTAILNSKVNFCYFKMIGAKLGLSGYEMSKIFVEILSIPTPTQEQEAEIVALVEQILEAKKQNRSTQDLEDQVDECVYKLYQLTPEEIELVKQEIKKTTKEEAKA